MTPDPRAERLAAINHDALCQCDFCTLPGRLADYVETNTRYEDLKLDDASGTITREQWLRNQDAEKDAVAPKRIVRVEGYSGSRLA